MHKAVDEMACAETFHGYAPDLGYDFLRNAIAKNDYEARGCDISADEILYLTEQNAIPEISRSCLLWIIRSLYATRCIRYM